MRWKKLLRGEAGQVLLLVLSVLFLLTILGAAGLVLAAGSKRASVAERERLQALYVAEAGVEKALADLKQRLIYPAPGFESFRIAGEPYAGGVIEEVYVTKETVGSSVYYTITSVGKYPEKPRPGQLWARKAVKAKILVEPDPFLAYGGPGLKSDTWVEMEGPAGMPGGISSIQGSLLARTGDVKLESLILEHKGGIYAGQDVRVRGSATFGGQGEIKAGRDVHLSGPSVSTWEGEIWAGNRVHGPWWQLGNVIVHENCGPNIPGFPLPQFPVVGKGSPWYERVKEEAQDQGRYFPNAAAWLDDDPEFGTGKGIRWDYSVLGPLFGTVTVIVYGAELNLEGITVIDGPLVLDASAYQNAYSRWQNRIRNRYPGMTVVFLDATLQKLKLRADAAASVVADSIAVDGGTLGIFGVDTSGINAPLGLFAANGDVTYKAFMGSGGRLSVLATGKFACQTPSWTPLNLDWVAAKEVVIRALVVVNEAQAAVPPGTPVGYRIVSWKIIS